MAAQQMNVARLYRDILKAAAQFPSVKRAAIIRDIKSEFRLNKDLTDQAEILKARKVAIDGLIQLEDFAGLDKKSTDWQVLFCTRHFPFGFQFTQEALRDDPGVEVVACDAEDVAQHIGDAHVAVPFMARLDDAALAAARQLRMVIQYGVGVETTDMAAATRRGIWVSNIPSVGMGNALSCAELVFYLMLALLRDANAMAASIESRRIGQPLGQTLAGKRVLVFGMGNIAAELLPRLRAFDAHITVVRSRSPPPADDAATDALRPFIDVYAAGVADLHRLLSEADIVVLTCTQNAATRGIVDAEFLARCRPGVRIVNVARGGLLDYQAVRAGLESGHIGGLGLDVAWEEPLDPQDPVFQHPAVVLSPHIAGVTEQSYRNMAKALAAEVRRVQAGLAPSVVLNPPLSGTAVGQA